jgi:NAD(P)-dependent dehydrogenase (short-subunit alcohol dehydrogenase family)
VNYRSNEAGATAVVDRIERARPGCSIAFRADVGDPGAVRAMVDRCVAAFGRIDVLVNNAAHAGRVRFGEITLEHWRETMRVNVDGAFHCVREVLPHMTRAGSGAIVNVSSHGLRSGRSSSVAYSASKGALYGFTRALATELAPLGIRVNSVLPGITDSEGHKGPADPDRRRAAEQLIPLGRAAAPEEIAAVILFLASADASYMTGTHVEIAGGR